MGLIKLLLVASATLSSVTAIGCYPKAILTNFKFGDLHGTNNDIYQELLNDISMSCNEAKDHSANNGGPGFVRCSEWEDYTALQQNHASGKNKIDWQIKHDGNGDGSRTLSYDACVKGFRQVLDSCPNQGGDLNSGGFWYRMDPNFGQC